MTMTFSTLDAMAAGGWLKALVALQLAFIFSLTTIEYMSEEIEESEAVEANESSDHELLEQIKRNFEADEEAWREVRQDALDDWEFRAGNQWPEAIKRERDQDDRPCLVINKMPQHINQITNEQRQNRPSIKISPVDDFADVETAKVFQGIIKHIENSSNASVAYDNATDGAATGGLGYIRVTTDYCDDMSFDQEIQIKQVYDWASVYFDANSKEPDGSDANHAFIHQEMSKDDFKREYPDAKISSMTDWTSVGDSDGWITKNTCRVAEYFYKKYTKAKIYQIRDLVTGEILVLKKDELPSNPTTYDILNERETLIPSIEWVKTNGDEILEKTTWPGKWIPIIPVYGKAMIVDGKRIFESVIRHAKDSQRMLNYWASTESETIALAPKAPFIVADGQIPDEYKNIWKQANRKNTAYLPYKPVSAGGNLVGPPQRNAYEAPIGAITQARMQSNDDIKATTGIYDASLGSKSNETSGIAIQRRNNQAQTSNFHFIDNLNRSIRHVGKILVDLIPKIYDTERALRIIGEDGTEEVVKVNTIFDGKPKNNLGAGKYDVVVETGPSFATKRQEAAAMMIDMTKAFPNFAQVAGDLILGNMDWPGAKEMQARIRKTLPPGLVDEKQGADIPEEAKAKLGQMEQMIHQLSGQLEQATQALNQKKIETESRERIETLKVNAQLEIAKAQIESKEALAGFQAHISTLDDDIMMMKQRLGLLNFGTPLENESGESIAVNQQGQM